MSHEPAGQRPPPSPVESDDIEILEVVGLDEDGRPVAESGDDLIIEFGDEQPGATDTAAARTGAAKTAGGPSITASEPAGGASDTAVRERLLRLQADFDNMRKRFEREKDDHYRHATGRLAARLLPILDSFEKAIEAGRQPGGIEALLEGMELVQRQLREELRLEGLEDIEALGQAFDPQVHDAVATVAASDENPPNNVVAVLRRGYFFHDRVLRPALVRVSVDDQGPTEPANRRED